MKKRNFKIVLIISLAFNIAFISLGTFRFMQMRNFMKREHFIHQIPQNLKDRFEHHRDEMGSIKAEIDEIRRDFSLELRKNDFNESLLREKLNEFLNKQSEMEKYLGQHLIELRSEMTPEQAEKFFSRLPEGRHDKPFEKRMPKNLRRFHEKDN